MHWSGLALNPRRGLAIWSGLVLATARLTSGLGSNPLSLAAVETWQTSEGVDIKHKT